MRLAVPKKRLSKCRGRRYFLSLSDMLKLRESSATVLNITSALAKQASNLNQTRSTSPNCNTPGDAARNNLCLPHWLIRAVVLMHDRLVATELQAGEMHVAERLRPTPS